MDLKHLFVLATLLALIVSMTGCTDESSGGSRGPGFEELSQSVTFNDYAGDPEHGDKEPTVEFIIPANAPDEEPPEDGNESESEGEVQYVDASFTRVFSSSGESMADEDDGGSGTGVLIYMISATLTWVDSDGENSDPDEFSLSVSCGEESNSGRGVGDYSQGGRLNITLGEMKSDGPDDYLADSAKIVVECIECGFTADRKPWGLLRVGHEDKGNEFKLEVVYKAWLEV